MNLCLQGAGTKGVNSLHVLRVPPGKAFMDRPTRPGHVAPSIESNKFGNSTGKTDAGSLQQACIGAGVAIFAHTSKVIFEVHLPYSSKHELASPDQHRNDREAANATQDGEDFDKHWIGRLAGGEHDADGRDIVGLPLDTERRTISLACRI